MTEHETLTAPRHPIQPIIDDNGTPRFKANKIVSALLDHGTAHGLGLNELAWIEFPDEDREQLAQLIGYSISGFGELSYVSDETYDAAVSAPETAAERDQYRELCREMAGALECVSVMLNAELWAYENEPWAKNTRAAIAKYRETVKEKA